MRKTIYLLATLFAITTFMCSCKGTEKGYSKKPDTAKDLIESYNEEAATQSVLDRIGYTPVYEDSTTLANDNAFSDKNIDVDLTTLSPTMVFAEVYNMLSTPDDYVGKTVRIAGTYYSAKDESTGKPYFYVIIQDATACCEQGMEFIWDNGTHKYPEEYPKEQTEITITGKFNYYTEDGLNFCYLEIDDL